MELSQESSQPSSTLSMAPVEEDLPAPALKPWDHDYELRFDADYTAELNQRIRDKFASKYKRSATHASDLFFCLRKSWARLHIPEAEQQNPSDDLVLTWSGGLQFEAIISTGDKQQAMAWCPECRAVGTPGLTIDGTAELANCQVCGTRWLVGTPDYIIDGIIHEVKQTRKSQRSGPKSAPWWADQIRTYIFFKRMAGDPVAPWGREVINWLMGDYGSRKKGQKPRPPISSLEAHQIIFAEETDGQKLTDYWRDELLRRKAIVEGKDMPPLNGMGNGDERSPSYEWECATCPVGYAIKCEQYHWTEDGTDINYDPNATAVREERELAITLSD